MLVLGLMVLIAADVVLAITLVQNSLDVGSSQGVGCW